MNTNTNRDLFREASSLGYINITSGNVIDTDYILKDILKRNEKNPIQELHYDKWNSTQFAIDATEAGLNLKPFSQLPGNLNKPLKEFETLIKRGDLIIENNSLTKWQMGNVILKVNHMGNYSIDKSSRSKKIDGVAAMINSLGGYLSTPRYSYGIY
jgi:phage terminase large subunit-like protein